MSQCRYDIIFTGQVQGVGFRFTTKWLAGGFAVTGWVRNEPDGSVRCVVEGQQEELDRFVSAIQKRMVGNIAQTNITTSQATGEFEKFTIMR